jgi:cbb3-type cytochrome oxidase cytochrome c subunit
VVHYHSQQSVVEVVPVAVQDNRVAVVVGIRDPTVLGLLGRRRGFQEQQDKANKDIQVVQV